MARKSKKVVSEAVINPDDEAECFSAYSEMRGEIARISQNIAALLNRYKKMGTVDTKQIPKAYAASQKDNATEQHQRLTAVLRRLDIIEWDEKGQGDFGKALTVKPTEASSAMLAESRARTDGYNTGYAGGLVEANKYHAGTREFAIWREQFFRGQADRKENHPEKEGVTRATPRKRGSRKGGAEDAQQPMLN